MVVHALDSPSFAAFDARGVRRALLGASLVEWTLGEDLEPDLRDFLDDVERVLCGAIVRTRLRAQRASHQLNHFAQTFEIVLDGGEIFYVRRPLPHGCRETAHGAASEAGLLRWLEEHSSIPVPPVIYSSHRFCILGALPGHLLINHLCRLDTHQKESLVISYAHIAIELFELPTHCAPGKGKPHGSHLFSTAGPVSAVFQTLPDLLAHHFAAAQRALGPGAERVLHTLERHAHALAARLPPRSLRPAHAHDALHAGAVLVDGATGVVSGVLGWGAHATLPRCLAARAPHWLRRDGVRDPRFAAPGAFWLESPAEGARLGALFERVVQSTSEEFYEALVAGRTLRAIVEWLTELHDEQSLERMWRWMQAEDLA